MAGLLGALLAAPALAQAPDGATAAPPRISIITFGPGELVWEKFGHNMIRVTDPVTGTDLAYNFGVFNFQQENFYWNFVQGRMLYALDVWPPGRTIDAYAAMGRSVEIQELALTPEQAWTLARGLALNAQPDQRDYRYEYYRDNCSTRVRDALNVALGGELEHQLAHIPTSSTFRSRTAELTADRPLIYFGLMLLLGPSTDQRLTAWEESFVPMDFARYLAPLTNPAAGDSVPLVAAQAFQAASGGLASPGRPPSRLLKWFLLAGLVLGGALVWLGSTVGAGGARGPFLVLGALWAFLSGLAGLVMVYLWAFTDHAVAYRNENLLQASILGLVMFGLFTLWARRGGAVPRGLGALAVTAALLSVAGLGMKFVPGPAQENWVVLAFFLPANLGLALGATRALRRPAITTGRTEVLP